MRGIFIYSSCSSCWIFSSISWSFATSCPRDCGSALWSRPDWTWSLNSRRLASLSSLLCSMTTSSSSLISFTNGFSTSVKVPMCCPRGFPDLQFPYAHEMASWETRRRLLESLFWINFTKIIVPANPTIHTHRSNIRSLIKNLLTILASYDIFSYE